VLPSLGLPLFLEDCIIPGRQLNFSIRGEQYEKAFEAIASRFLSVVRVPRPDDYGIDAYCHILRPLDETSSTAGGVFGVQVGGPGRNLQFAGMNEKGNTWKAYEIEWLRSLAVPYYFARVNADCTRVDFYSLWPIWIVLARAQSLFGLFANLTIRQPVHLSYQVQRKSRTAPMEIEPPGRFVSGLLFSA
jgi:hypothetical protein